MPAHCCAATILRRRLLHAAHHHRVTLVMVLSTANPATRPPARSVNARSTTAYMSPINQVGDPYRYGADGPSAFDCSGLTMFSYRRAGLYLPRSSDGQARYVRHVLRKNMRRGDLMFFTSGGHVYHVGIFVGVPHGRALAAARAASGERVHRERVWTNAWFPGTLRYR